MHLENIYNIRNSHVFLRADMDVPLDTGKIESNFRIRKCIETIKLLIEHQNKVVIFTKIGRPENREKHLSTKNILEELKKLTNHHVLFVQSVEELKLLDKSKEKLLLFENTRFFEWENDDPASAARVINNLANHFEYYVDEAFAISHRQETSNYNVPKIIGKIALGLNYANEIANLDKLKNGEFEKPAFFILGGAKVETKLPMIEKLINKFDLFLLGGLMPKEIKHNPNILNSISNKVFLADLTEEGFDITNSSTTKIIEYIKNAKTIVWNGPTGMFENEKYTLSTKTIIHALETNNNAYKVVGGGDTVTAIEKFGNLNNYSFVSTGGGAMFNYLAGNGTNIDKLFENKG